MKWRKNVPHSLNYIDDNDNNNNNKNSNFLSSVLLELLKVFPGRK